MNYLPGLSKTTVKEPTLKELLEKICEWTDYGPECIAQMALDHIENQDKRIAEIETRHDNFLREFWKTNAENSDLEANYKKLLAQHLGALDRLERPAP